MFSTKLIALSILNFIFTASCAPVTLDKNTHLLYQFPNGTWVENIAVRSNNQLLLTTLTPNLYSLDPDNAGSRPVLIHRFSETAVFGIAEIGPDVFAVIAGNYSLQTGNTPGSYSIWKVKFQQGQNDSSPEVSLIGPVPQATFLNGMCALPNNPGGILLGDIGGGQIFRMDTQTGAVSIAVPSNNSLVSTARDPIFGTVGVDGIHVLGDELYAANAGTGYFAKLKINPDGTPAPGAEPVIIEKAANGTYQDDFALDGKGDAFLVTGSGNTIIEVGPGGEQRLIAGNLNSTEIAEPTSVAFSRREGDKRLFVVTAGGLAAPVNGDEIVGGQVLAIDLE